MRSKGAHTTTRNLFGTTHTRQRHKHNLVFNKQLKPSRDHQSPPFPDQFRNTNSHTLSYHKNTSPAHGYIDNNKISPLSIHKHNSYLTIQSNPHTDSSTDTTPTTLTWVHTKPSPTRTPPWI